MNFEMIIKNKRCDNSIDTKTQEDLASKEAMGGPRNCREKL